MIEALWPPKPKLLLITVRSLRSRDRLHTLQLKMTDVDIRPLFADVKNFDANDSILGIVVDDDAGPNFLRIDYFGAAKFDIGGVHVGIVFQLHKLYFARRTASYAKNANKPTVANSNISVTVSIIAIPPIPTSIRHPIWRESVAHAVESAMPYAAAPAMIDALWPPKPKLLDMTTRRRRSRGVLGV